jgi:NADH-quinone oxidoreductase subunit A
MPRSIFSVDLPHERARSKLKTVTLADYLPIGIMLLLAAGFVAVSLIASGLVRPDRPTEAKLDPYESGIVPETEPSQRFPVKFYLVAMLFVIFDVEIIFLFAWASIYDRLGWYGVAAILIFTFFVAETLAYVWKRGALDWNVHRRSRYIAAEASDEAA